MAEEKDEINDSNKLAQAKLALSGEEKLSSWKKTAEDFEKRREEAARAMASDEQKKAWEEAERARLAKIEAQKKLADLEAERKLSEEEKKKNLSEEQKKRDEQAEAERIARIDEILKSQREIDLIKKDPNAGPAPIRTLTRDLGEAISKEGLSASKIITRTPDKENFSLKKRGGFSQSWLAGIGVILVVGGLIALVWAINQRQSSSLAPVISTRQGIIFSDNQQTIDLDKNSSDQIRNILRDKSLTPPGTKESIQEIYFTYQVKEQAPTGLVIKQQEADPTTISLKLGLKLPDEFLRFLEPKMMLGFYYGEQTAPFYIFKTKNYKNVASAILNNENAIVSDLLNPFADASTTEKIKTQPLQDKMIRNYDTRLLVDETNTVVVLYSWLDQETLIFTTDENSFSKILNSYSSTK